MKRLSARRIRQLLQKAQEGSLGWEGSDLRDIQQVLRELSLTRMKRFSVRVYLEGLGHTMRVKPVIVPDDAKPRDIIREALVDVREKFINSNEVPPMETMAVKGWLLRESRLQPTPPYAPNKTAVTMKDELYMDRGDCDA